MSTGFMLKVMRSQGRVLRVWRNESRFGFQMVFLVTLVEDGLEGTRTGDGRTVLVEGQW